MDNMLTSDHTYARTRSDGVPDLSTIDRRQARPVYIETSAVVPQEK